MTPWGEVPRNWLYGGVLLLTAFVFGSTLSFGFVYDDHWTLLGNGFLRDLGHLPMLLSPEASKAGVPDAFRPTSVVFDALTYALFGLSSLAHHATSIALHVLVTGLAGLWLAREGAPRTLVVTTITLFGVLAIHGEAVAVVSYREDLLAAALGLASMSFARAHVVRPRSWMLVASGLLMLLAAGAKLSVAGLPLAWAALQLMSPWDTTRPRKRTLVAAATMVLGIGLFLAFRSFVLGGIDPYGLSERVYTQRVGLSSVLAASTQIHLSYLWQLWVPRGLSPEYVDFGARWTHLATICATLSLGGFLAVALLWARKRPLFAWVVIAALVLALPTSNLAPMPNMRADRFVYLTSLPICVGMATSLLTFGLWMHKRFGLPALAPWIAMVVLQGSLLQGATAAYRSDSRLWQVALQRAPNSARAHAVLGELLISRLQAAPDPRDQPLLLVRARTHCALALYYDPEAALSHLCVARLAAAERAWTRSHAAFERALVRMTERRERAYLALASTALDVPQWPYEHRVTRALHELERARHDSPFVAEVFAVSGRLRQRLGQPEGAEADFLRARKLHPERWDVVMAGVELQLDLGHTAAAARAWSEATDTLEQAPRGRVDALRRRIHANQRLHSNP